MGGLLEGCPGGGKGVGSDVHMGRGWVLWELRCFIPRRGRQAKNMSADAGGVMCGCGWLFC